MSVIRWRKSSYCQGSGDCVEVAEVNGRHLVRDSKDPHGPALTFTGNEWSAFVRGIHNGEFGLG